MNRVAIDIYRIDQNYCHRYEILTKEMLHEYRA